MEDVMKSYLKIGMSAALGALMFSAPSAMADDEKDHHRLRHGPVGLHAGL
jgi:hypothetical protein